MTPKEGKTMKKFAVSFMAVAFLVLSASFVFADATVKENSPNSNAIHIQAPSSADANATGGTSISDQEQNQDQQQKQKQIQSTNGVSGSQTVVYKNHIVAPLLSQFVNAPTSEVPQGWKQIVCDPAYAEFTIGELKSMANSGSFLDRRGNFWHALWSRQVKGSIRTSTGKILDDNTVIRVINRIPAFGSGAKSSGTYEGTGDYGWPVDEIFGKTVLEAVIKTGSIDVAVWWDFQVERLTMASTFGIGGTASHVDGSASSGSVGVSSSKAYALTEVAYKVKAVPYNNVAPEYFLCEIPKTTIRCNLEEIILRLHKAEEEIFICKRYSYNNLFWQRIAEIESLNAWLCTGDMTYLEDAIQHGQMAELNYIHGYDITRHNDSEKLIGDVEYWLASSFYARDGSLKNYWKAPKYVVHVDRKRGNAKPIALTPYEKKRVEKLRGTLERYSKKLTF